MAGASSCVVESALRTSERLGMTTWVALIILALGAMLLILNESGMIAGLDTAISIRQDRNILSAISIWVGVV